MEEFIKYLTLRGSVYRMLALAFYREPLETDFIRLKKYLPIFKEIGRGYGNSDLTEGAEVLKLFFSDYEEDEAVSLCGRLFTEIFLSTGLSLGKKSVIPQESVYLSPGHISMQEPRDEVLEEYYKWGLGKEQGFSEPEDHVSAELYFSAWLGDKLGEELKRGTVSHAEETAKQMDCFTENHLLRWVPVMCSDLARISEDGYYNGIALITKGFIAFDRQLCKDVSSV